MVPIVFLLASVLMLANSLIENPISTGRDFAIILVGIPVYLVWRTRVNRKPARP
jgi:hypothetical protein